MDAQPELFKVTVAESKVRIERLTPNDKDYESFTERVMLRERDAIQAFRDRKDRGDSLDGLYIFANLENAKSFALLQLMTIQEGVADNLDEIQAYAG